MQGGRVRRSSAVYSSAELKIGTKGQKKTKVITGEALYEEDKVENKFSTICQSIDGFEMITTRGVNSITSNEGQEVRTSPTAKTDRKNDSSTSKQSSNTSKTKEKNTSQVNLYMVTSDIVGSKNSRFEGIMGRNVRVSSNLKDSGADDNNVDIYSFKAKSTKSNMLSEKEALRKKTPIRAQLLNHLDGFVKDSRIKHSDVRNYLNEMTFKAENDESVKKEGFETEVQKSYLKKEKELEDYENDPREKKLVAKVMPLTNSTVKKRLPKSKSPHENEARPNEGKNFTNVENGKVNYVKQNARRSNSVTPPVRNEIEWINESVSGLPPIFPAQIAVGNLPYLYMVSSNTHNGTQRTYNEDRVVVTMQAFDNKKMRLKTASKEGQSPAMFSIFDGHGSSECSQFLADRMHMKLFERYFPDFTKMPSTIKTLFNEIDFDYKKMADKEKKNYSGACACTVIIHARTVHILNLGDSRCIASYERGKITKHLTEDQKPSKPSEFERIMQAGGFIYRTVYDVKRKTSTDQRVKSLEEIRILQKTDRKNKDIEIGPWRMNPGALSLSRGFGDFEYKLSDLGGCNGALISEPVHTSFPVQDIDFLIIGCKLIR